MGRWGSVDVDPGDSGSTTGQNRATDQGAKETRMKFLVLLHMNPARMSALSPREAHQLQVESARTDEALMRAGTLLAAEALAEPSIAFCVRRRGGAVAVTDGPFVETKEHLGGFMLVEARDREEAVRLVSSDDDRFLELGTTYEIRPVHDYRAELAARRPAG